MRKYLQGSIRKTEKKSTFFDRNAEKTYTRRVLLLSGGKLQYFKHSPCVWVHSPFNAVYFPYRSEMDGGWRNIVFYVNQQGLVLESGSSKDSNGKVAYWLEVHGNSKIRIIPRIEFDSEELLEEFEQTELKEFLEKLDAVPVPMKK